MSSFRFTACRKNGDHEELGDVRILCTFRDTHVDGPGKNGLGTINEFTSTSLCRILRFEHALTFLQGGKKGVTLPIHMDVALLKPKAEFFEILFLL
jgi:hypothetical protein